MKSFGEIMRELGFNPDSPVSVQKAFFKHLAQDTTLNQPKKQLKSKTVASPEYVQLEFDFDDEKRVS